MSPVFIHVASSTWDVMGLYLTLFFFHIQIGNEKKKCHCGAKNCSSFLGVRPKNQIQEDKAKKTGDKRKKKRIKKTIVKEGTQNGTFNIWGN